MVKISPRSYMVDTLHCTPYTVRSGSPAPPRPARGPAARPAAVCRAAPDFFHSSCSSSTLIFLKMSYN